MTPSPQDNFFFMYDSGPLLPFFSCLCFILSLNRNNRLLADLSVLSYITSSTLSLWNKCASWLDPKKPKNPYLLYTSSSFCLFILSNLLVDVFKTFSYCVLTIYPGEWIMHHLHYAPSYLFCVYFPFD